MKTLEIGTTVKGTNANRGWPGTNEGVITDIAPFRRAHGDYVLEEGEVEPAFAISVRFEGEEEEDAYTVSTFEALNGPTVFLYPFPRGPRPTVLEVL